MIYSMLRVAKCIDNGPMESFRGTFKCEKYYLHKYSTFEELSMVVKEYKLIYNHNRNQKRNGLSPIEYRLTQLKNIYIFTTVYLTVALHFSFL